MQNPTSASPFPPQQRGLNPPHVETVQKAPHRSLFGIFFFYWHGERAALNMRPLSTPFVHGQEPGPTPPPAASLSASATTCEQLPIPKLLSFPFALLK